MDGDHIDQSESMGGSATASANDADGQRFDAAVTIADYLANHSAWLCAEEGIQHRIAVVGFGDLAASAQNGPDNPYEQDTKIYLPPTVIPLDEAMVKTQEELTEAWNNRRQDIEARSERALLKIWALRIIALPLWLPMTSYRIGETNH
ncbi:MAG: hypothetical protein IPH82_08910 [Chloroflexi bacterium]|nr:hypothetical protein [Chloroflexota bacterium]